MPPEKFSDDDILSLLQTAMAGGAASTGAAPAPVAPAPVPLPVPMPVAPARVLR